MKTYGLDSSSPILRSVLTELRSRDGQGQYAPEDQADPSAFKKAYSNRWKIAASIAALGIGGAATLGPRLQRFGGKGILGPVKTSGLNRAKKAAVNRNANLTDKGKRGKTPPYDPGPSLSGKGKAATEINPNKASGQQKTKAKTASMPASAAKKKAAKKKVAKKKVAKKKESKKAPQMKGSGGVSMKKTDLMNNNTQITELQGRIARLIELSDAWQPAGLQDKSDRYRRNYIRSYAKSKKIKNSQVAKIAGVGALLGGGTAAATAGAVTAGVGIPFHGWRDSKRPILQAMKSGGIQGAVVGAGLLGGLGLYGKTTHNNRRKWARKAGYNIKD